MDVHESARLLLEAEELPKIKSSYYARGLCSALRDAGGMSCGMSMSLYGRGTPVRGGTLGEDRYYLDQPGKWTEQRLNLACLLACTEESDWLNEGEMT